MINKITEIELEFLKILESFMHDGEYRFQQGFEGIQEIMDLATIHHVVPMVYEQVRTDELWQNEKFHELQVYAKKNSIYMTMSQIQRTEGFLDVYQKLVEAGVKPLVVKGLICRSLYKKPDYRISGDEDVLVSRKNFDKCDAILRENGFERAGGNHEDTSYEVAYIHPRTRVYIELHFTLFPEKSEAYGFLNEEFKDASERCVSEEIQGVPVWTLSPTDHMFYLISHSFKHFLHSGFGVRQVCDIVMMAEHYGEQIDWTVLERKLRRWSMMSFWAALAEIGRRYLGFDWEKAKYCTKLQDAYVGHEELLKDLLQSGVYGNSSMERRHSSNITLAAMRTGKKNMGESLRATLFPPIDFMKNRYEWLQKYPVFLPVAWLMRMYSYKAWREKKKEKNLSGLTIGMERVELLKKYRIIQ